MKCAEKLKKVDFHDSLVENFIYKTDESLINIEIELCNWKQKNYRPDDSEMLTGIVTFIGVSEYYHEPAHLIFNSDEILTIEFIYDADESREKIKMVLRGDDDVKLITFYAKDVELGFPLIV